MSNDFNLGYKTETLDMYSSWSGGIGGVRVHDLSAGPEAHENGVERLYGHWVAHIRVST